MTRALKILYLVDNDVDAEMLRVSLERRWPGLLIEQVGNRDAFARMLEDREWDIAFLDNSLPEYDGISALNFMRTNYQNIPVIFITPTMTEDEALGTIALGAFDYLIKGDCSRLVPSVQRAIMYKDELDRNRMAEESLLHASHEWHQTFDAVSDSICILDNENRITRCNRATCELTGKRFKELIGQHCWNVFHDADLPLEECPSNRARRNKASASLDMQIGDRWLTVLISPVIEDNGEVLNLVHVVRDVTGQKNYEKLIENTRERLQLAVMAGRMGVWEYNVLDDMLVWDDMMMELYGLKRMAFHADLKAWQACLHDDDRERATEEVMAAIHDERPFDTEFRVNRGDGELRVIRACATVEHDRLGNAVRMVGINWDITESRNAFDNLRMMQAQMINQEKLASLGQLAAGVAHEINNPVGFISSNLSTLEKYLSRITSYMDMLESASAGACQTEQLEALKKSRKDLKLDRIIKDVSSLISESIEGTQRVRSIVADLKSFAREDKKEMEPINLNNCITSALNVVRNEYKYVATLDLRLDDSLPEVIGNNQQLGQVVANLVVNSAHAIESKGEGQGEIVVSTASDSGHAVLVVSDTGKGIATEHMKRIFEPFFTTKEAGKGTGLGLAISYDIIKKHGGQITVNSEIGKGTVFTIRLPIAQIP